MIDINVPNFISIFIMSAVAIAAMKLAKNAGATWVPV